MNKRIIICTGGTGGHVIPAINFGNFLIDHNYECLMILDKRGAKYLNNFKGKSKIIESSHLSGNLLFKIISLVKLLFGFIKSLLIIVKYKPNICITFGSYATFMPLISIIFLKFFLRTKIYIHEQNSIIGKVNLFFLPYAKIVFTNFENIVNLKKKYIFKKEYVGIPSYEYNKNLQKIYIEESKKIIIFIYGGSQGSAPLIDHSILILKKIDKDNLKKIKIIIQSPKKKYVELSEFFKKLNIDYEINEFYNNIDMILSIANIAITRGGAGTINDLIRHKVPSLIFPLPHAIYNHQYYNAKYLSDIKAAVLIDEKNINIDRTVKILLTMINDLNYRKNMKIAFEQIDKLDTNQLMLNKIFS